MLRTRRRNARMAIRTSFPHRQPGASNGLRLFRILPLILGLAFSGTHSLAQKTNVAPSPPRKSAAILSPFAEAETLLREGSVEEARQKTQEQLALHPTSVAGYNLLGIVYTKEKDYASANQAFQHALKLDPDSTKTHNNLGNLYVAQEKHDLAEREFRTVLRFAPADRDGNYNLGLLLMAKALPAE